MNSHNRHMNINIASLDVYIQTANVHFEFCTCLWREKVLLRIKGSIKKYMRNILVYEKCDFNCGLVPEYSTAYKKNIFPEKNSKVSKYIW